MFFVMSLLAISTGLLSNVVMNQSIPTRAEQADLLLNVHEVFEQIQLLTKDEADATDKSVVQDIASMVKRAEYVLELLEKLYLLRLSCENNSVCMLDAKPKIKKIASDGRHALQMCMQQGKTEIEATSNKLSNSTAFALGRSQELLDSLEACSKKSGLAIISCYRNIIITDVIPVKRILLDGIQSHKDAHMNTIDIRNSANMYVDNVIKTYKDFLETAFTDSLKCT